MQKLSGINSVAAPVQATVGTTVVVNAGASARTRFLQAVVKRSQAALKRAAAKVI